MLTQLIRDNVPFVVCKKIYMGIQDYFVAIAHEEPHYKMKSKYLTYMREGSSYGFADLSEKDIRYFKDHKNDFVLEFKTTDGEIYKYVNHKSFKNYVTGRKNH